jgi:hypothetical protein
MGILRRFWWWLRGYKFVMGVDHGHDVTTFVVVRCDRDGTMTVVSDGVIPRAAQ